MAEKQAQYPHARKYLSGHRWAIRQETLSIMCDLLHMREQGITLTEPEIQARIGAASSRPSPAMSGSVAVIPLCGVIDQKVNSMTAISGGTSVDGFMAQFRGAVNDPNVSAIVIDCDSPGGNVSGVPEAADEIYKARGTKRIVAVADSMMASAALYLCAGADEIVCMPSGEVGSVGVVAVHDDYSAQNEMIGYTPTYVTYGQYKAEFNSDSPMTDDAKAYLQTQINALGDMFVKFLAKARGVSVSAVKSDFGDGRMLMPQDALAAKMIDRIDTLDNTIARLSGRKSGAGRAAEHEHPEMESSDETITRSAAVDIGAHDDLLDEIEMALSSRSRI